MNETMTETMSLEALEAITKTISGLKNIEKDEDSVTFLFRDKDGDNIVGVIQLLSEEKASVCAFITVPDSHAITSMIASNFYNNQDESYGTFSYTTKTSEDKWYIVLESHICTRGGMNKDAIRYQLRTLTDKINSFEKSVIETIQEYGPDSSFMKSGFWSTIGSFAGGFMRGYGS